ncbi:primosomal protein N' [Oscillospiraceae bacterium CM]|nr:primosomal protein N' [Oscillospiraceae bacterium CM]
MENFSVAKLAVAVGTYHIDKPYDYKIPAHLADTVVPGIRVCVPFGKGNRKTEALVLSVTAGDGARALKAIESCVDASPVLSHALLKLALWMSDRFFCTVYDAAKAMLPAGMWLKDGVLRSGDKTVTLVSLAVPAEEALCLAGQKRARARQQATILELLAQLGSVSVPELLYFTGASRSSIKALIALGAVVTEEHIVLRRPAVKTVAGDPITLNHAQQRVFDGLVQQLFEATPQAALIHGVTGSGKTAVYLMLIEKTLEAGRSAVILVPEIALTPQLLSTFTAYFGDRVAVLHSALSLGERFDEWKRIKAGSARVVIGTRSAVFAPVKDLGLFIIDEEHEHTYKSENIPRYHARDVAKYRCVSAGALLVLGSATPSIESMYSAEAGKYALYHLETRFNDGDLPPVIIADMKEELKNGNGGIIGAVLRRELASNIDRGEQSILFLNRRGDTPLVACPACGYTFTCPRCSVSLTYHSANGRLMCHYCGYSEPSRGDCPECGGKLRHTGAGTQKAEAELNALFPGVGIIRMDTDTVTLARTHEEHLTRFREKRIPILLGTQMVAKGLDFENVTLVGVLSADQMLYINDFRAHERTFSLITQVVGRSGRGSKPGRAVIQTLTPTNDVIRLAARQDYNGFYTRELALRQLAGSPPFSDIIMLTASGTDETAVLRGCVTLKSTLLNYLAGEDVHVMGPVPAAVMRVNNRYRYRILLSLRTSRQLRDTVAHVIRQFAADKAFRGVHVYADADPYDL